MAEGLIFTRIILKFEFISFYLVFRVLSCNEKMNNEQKEEKFILGKLFIYKFLIVKKSLLGDSSGGGTPGSIPNPAVKPTSADGTWGATLWESRSLPRGLFYSPWYIVDPVLQ